MRLFCVRLGFLGCIVGFSVCWPGEGFAHLWYFGLTSGLHPFCDHHYLPTFVDHIGAERV